MRASELGKPLLPMSNPALEIRGLTKIFRPAFGKLRMLYHRSARQDVVALSNIDLTVQPGEILGLVGRNGQGKTTLVKTISALVEPTAGHVKVFGFDTRTQADRVRARVGLVGSDERSFYGRLTGCQNLLFFARLNGLSKSVALQRIRSLADALEFGSLLDRRFHELSTGNKQRLAIIRALLNDPPLLLLDEPTRSLDPVAADRLRTLIHDQLSGAQRKTILITSHNLEEVESICSRVGFLWQNQMRLCAAMEELRSEYCCRERVTIRASGVDSTNGLNRMRGEVPGMDVKDLGSGLTEIHFQHDRKDEQLDYVLREIIHSGARILSCDAAADGLREIMNEIEK